ncbi:type I restriction modification DNA specificity domain protein [Candidatus Apopatosoma intestinale]|nr:type I restriction modification DNA specificity domain protein [Candidatus Apopatosoma intestinale]
MKFKLSDVMDLIGGGTPKTSKAEYWNGTIPWLSVKDFNNGFRYVYETEKTITELGLENSSTKLLQKGDVIISARGTVGEIATIPFPMAFNQSCYGLRAKRGIVTSDYLYYLIKHNVSVLKKNTHGSVFDTITRNTFDNIEVEIPSIKIQEKIASILSDYDEKIELNNAINNNLEQQVSALYQSWFEDLDPTNGVCPDNWSYQMLSTIADISSGKRPPIKSEVYSQETPISIVGAASAMGFTSEANHTDKILVTGRVGTHGVIQRFNTPCWTSDNTLVITSPFYEFANQILHRIDYSSMNRGSTQPLITQGDMKKVVVLVPDEETLAKFEALAGSLMAQWEANNNENVKLASLRDTLLPKLMSGELDVSDIEI